MCKCSGKRKKNTPRGNEVVYYEVSYKMMVERGQDWKRVDCGPTHVEFLALPFLSPSLHCNRRKKTSVP